jgi:hypothetical protein
LVKFWSPKPKLRVQVPFTLKILINIYVMNEVAFYNDGLAVIKKSDLLFKFLDILKSNQNNSILCFMRINDVRFQKKVRCDLKKYNIKAVFFNGRLIGRLLNNLYLDMFLNSVFLIHVNTSEILFTLMNSIDFKHFTTCISIKIEKYILLLINYKKLLMIKFKHNQFFSFYFLFFRYFNFYYKLVGNLYYFIRK